MVNIPGREGAVTGGTFDQSNRPLLPALPVAGAGACDDVGATVVLPAGAGSAAEAWSVRPSMPARPDFTSRFNARCGEVEKQGVFLAGVNEAGRQSGRCIAGFQGLRKNARNYSKIGVDFELTSNTCFGLCAIRVAPQGHDIGICLGLLLAGIKGAWISDVRMNTCRKVPKRVCLYL